MAIRGAGWPLMAIRALRDHTPSTTKTKSLRTVYVLASTMELWSTHEYVCNKVLLWY